jgi:vanillate O-demethylase ferredoxin subunit
MHAKLVWIDATISEAREITPIVRLIRFDTGQVLGRVSPGSHIQIEVETPHGGAKRSYSCVSAEDSALTVAVRKHAHSRGGSDFMWRLAAGDRTRISLPDNRFELSWASPHYLLMAGGIGITPIFGMAKALAARGASLRLVYGGKTRAELAFAGDLAGLLGDRFELFAADEGRRINIADEISALPEGAELYLCGPIDMLSEARAAWKASGRPPGRLRFEVFGDSGEHAEQRFTVSVPSLGRTLTVEANETLLEALRGGGVDMVSDCERGECGLCAVRILGHDRPVDHRDVFLSDGEKRENSRMCSCVSRFAGGHAIIDVGFRPVARSEKHEIEETA